MVMLLLGKGWKIPTKRRESKIFLDMITATLAGCVLDAIGWAVDGQPGMFNRVIVYACNTMLFSLNVVIGPGCITVVSEHIKEKPPAWHRKGIAVLCIAELSLLAVNFFVPLVFSVDADNVYHRGAFFWVYMAVEFVLILYALGMYIRARLQGRLLSFFPAWLFVLPLVIAILVQSMVYGVSLIWTCIGISFCGLIISIQKESIYFDRLTGVYNRYFLDDVGGILRHRRGFAALMLDMNGFKEINDKYSHAEGDAALVAIANILSETVLSAGTVVRFAGDEFIVLLDEPKPDSIEAYKNKIQAAIDAYNETSGKPYLLSAAIGGAVFDTRRDKIAEFMSKIDRQMYEDKERYYSTHERRARQAPARQGEGR